MSEPIPEAIPTSADPRSRRPVKRARVANPVLKAQADEIQALFVDPNRPIHLHPVSHASKATLPAPPEIVANVQGSSAGAGSGEFHVYKASRRREYERLRVMDEEAKKEEQDEKWSLEERERRAKDEEKTRKNRERRDKRKGKKDGPRDGGNGRPHENQAAINGDKTKKAGTAQIPRRRSIDEDDTADFAVAEVVKEAGITIHDDD